MPYVMSCAFVNNQYPNVQPNSSIQTTPLIPTNNQPNLGHVQNDTPPASNTEPQQPGGKETLKL